MSVMESMRSGSDSPLMQFVFAAVVVSFIGWGVGTTGSTTGTVATVNGDAITDLTFGQAYRTAENRMSSRSDQAMTEDQRAALREQVLQDLIRQRALLQEASALGLEVSSKEIAEALLDLEFLRDEKGAFDKRAYFNFLRQRGLTRANFEDQIREDLLVRKLQGLMILGASVSDATVQQRYIDASTKVDVQYVRLRPSQFLERIEPTAEDVAEVLADRADEVRARYDDAFATAYDLPEVVDLSVIRLAVRDDGLGISELKARLDALEVELAGGAGFAELARRWSEDPSAAEGGVVADQKVPQLQDALKDAVAKLQPGERTIVVGDVEVRLVRLDARRPARQIPFDEVKEDLARTLFRETEAPARAAAFAEKELLPAWTAAGAPPEALLAEQDLTVQSTGPITPAGSGGLLRPPEKMLNAARTAEVGAVLPEVYEEDGVLWVGALVAREDPDMAEFEANKDKIREQALLAHRFEFFEAWVDDVVARAEVVR